MKVRVVFINNDYMNMCGYDHTIDCVAYNISTNGKMLCILESKTWSYYPLSNILFIEDLSNQIN